MTLAPGGNLRQARASRGARIVAGSPATIAYLGALMETPSDIAGRLAAGSKGRTEDIQSDVRKFLLDAPLDLDQGEMPEVALEAQAGGGRRIDVEAGWRPSRSRRDSLPRPSSTPL